MDCMKDVVLNEEEREEKFEKLLTKICRDFKINNSSVVIKSFIKNRKKQYKNQPIFSHLVLGNYKKSKRSKKRNADFMLFVEIYKEVGERNIKSPHLHHLKEKRLEIETCRD